MKRACCLPVFFLAYILGPELAPARIFEPFPPPPPWQSDARTEAIFEFRRFEFDKKEMPDVTGRNPAGKIEGGWEFVEAEELRPNFAGAGRALKGQGPRAEVNFPALAALGEGAFSVDLLLRWDRGGGYVLRMGKEPEALLLGVLHRGPGLFELRVPVKTADGGKAEKLFASGDIYREAGPARFDEFYTYSLTYDGKQTFRVLIDGREVFEGSLDEGTAYAPSTNMAIGQVGRWKTQFYGEIAAVRVSRGVREYEASAERMVFDPDARGGWTFDAGSVESPVEPGAIQLDRAEAYDAAAGFGWAGMPVSDFDAWYVAGRYIPTPEGSFAKNEHKALDALQRDGVVLGAGDIFRANVPDGRYWVSVEVGHNRGSSHIGTISANGVVLGKDLRTSANLFKNRIVGRTARALVTVENGSGLLIRAQTEPEGGEVPVKSIEILPYAPLPVSFEKGKIVWQGKGDAPEEVASVSAALATGDRAQAGREAEKITDPFVQACVLAHLLGQPSLPEKEDLARARRIRQLLIQVLREQPDNVAARWLFDSTERFRHALAAYLDNAGTEVVYGSRFGVWVSTGNQGLQLAPEDPQYWQGRFLAGASMWQSGIQGSAFDMEGTSDAYVPAKRGNFLAFDAPGPIFREVIAAYPDFRAARIMLGEKLRSGAAWTPPENAPKWAVLQKELLDRILEVTHFWINERMDSRGLLGGGLGDDVEVLRWWTPGIVLADDPTTAEGWNRMAEAAWNSTNGAGYSLGMDDVEHSAEPTADPLPMLALINYGTPAQEQSFQRLTRMLPIFRDIWTTVTPEGYRMFKGYHFNATAIQREGDVPYNIRAIKPLLWAAWADPANTELKDLVMAYSRSWRDAIMAEFGGKPRGIVPMMIKLDRKRAHEDEAKNWVAAGYATYAYPLGYAEKVYDLMLAAYALSGDTSYLEPIRYGLEAMRKVDAADRDPAKYPEGSFEWAVRAGLKNFGIAGGSYRLMTGDTSFDDVLVSIAPAYVRFLIKAGEGKGQEAFEKALEPVIERLEKCVERMNMNPELRTTIVQSTDRIYVTGSLLLNCMATGAVSAASSLSSIDDDLRGGEFVWPTFQITWRGTGGATAVLVRDGSPDDLDVMLYNFSEEVRTLKPQVWRLSPGTYELVLQQTNETGEKVEKELARQTVEIRSRGDSLAFELPPQVPARLQVARK